MRIIHTADWHIGQTLRGYPREHEHRAVLDELVRVVAEREADALIVAGDVFDGQNPSGESQRLFYETLVKLHKASLGLQIVITAGNHDAAGRIEAPKALLEGIGAHVVGNVRRVDGKIAAARHVIPLRAADGQIAAHVLAVSYPTAACLPAVEKAEDGSWVMRATKALYDELAEAARPSTAGLPLIATGHLHVSGGIESEGAERRILVGGQHAVPPDVFPEDASYVALGHLHKAQTFSGDRVRYSGSLMPLSATELPYKHGVTLLTLEGEGVTSIEHIELQRPVPFIRLPATGEVRLDELGDHLKALDPDADLPVDYRPFVQVRLSPEGLGSGHRAEADRIAESFPVRIVDYKVGARAESTAATEAQAPIVRLAERAPEDLFRDAYQRLHGEEPDTRHRDVFHQALAAAGAEA